MQALTANFFKGDHMNSVSYKGYDITPTPMQLRENKEWTTSVTIAKDRGNSVTSRQFSASNTFKTEDEAIKHSILFAQQVIDGIFTDLSVDDL